ncbi:SMI1/KNR4 family protein [Rubripirellula amarantea]|uniref:SMI1 / KNR4 family protein n=1 Tax=Rubripirellula amarantea TaxID=2527999 RepID=A0A5C5WHH8_9BACT|nr:SMI1/KNR4 family protein [Rubripirellula amarantea]MDA8743273.1 SMI1/KNR4 family protein [Rubripirellula amarantea]TWT49559.1 SMI1 / KNR4 family protein [Rubripirellula amarantea]
MQEHFDALLTRLKESDVASSDDLVGCTSREIARLEARYSIALPKSYRWYLSTMGKRSGRLFTHDHMAVYFDHVFEMTDQLRREAIDDPDEPYVELPDDALVIAGRLAEQYQFIRCGDSMDSPVWYFNEYDYEIVVSCSSVLDWLNSYCDLAEQAIANGYFDIYPEGTTP